MISGYKGAFYGICYLKVIPISWGRKREDYTPILGGWAWKADGSSSEPNVKHFFGRWEGKNPKEGRISVGASDERYKAGPMSVFLIKKRSG